MAQDFNNIPAGLNIPTQIPLNIKENIINEFNTIKNLQNLISANGNNFNLTQDELELAQKLF